MVHTATHAELEKDLALGTGCELDNAYIWTADPCGSDNSSFMVAKGSYDASPVRKRVAQLYIVPKCMHPFLVCRT